MDEQHHPRALAGRARSHARGAPLGAPGGALGGALAIALFAAGGCEGADDPRPPAAAERAPAHPVVADPDEVPPATRHPELELVEASDAARAQIDELIEALTPVAKTVTSDIEDRWFIRQQKLVAELMQADEDVGAAALRAYFEYQGEVSNVRRGLLTIAAFAAPKQSEDLLHHLMVDYGHRIDDRTEATLLLAETAPEHYLETTERYLLRRGRPNETMPNDEFLVRGWVLACEALGSSPAPMMADVVTNLAMEPAARYFAAETLGRYPSPLGREALETALIESTGDGYLRRKAAQAMRESLPREAACDLFHHVLAREVDENFKAFLENMIQVNCR